MATKKKKVSKNRMKKMSAVKEIADKIKKAKSIIFVDYKGSNVANTTALRAAMRKEGIDYKVYKNNLLILAFKEAGIAVPEEVFAQTLAVAFSYNDEVAPARILHEMIIKTKKMELKFGVLNGNYVDGSYVKGLAVIPSREVLIAKLLFLMKAPIQKFAICINEIAKKQA